ncbi:endothelin-2 [Genypterus blacodes]|uniref:endothelin-2 n=1 Tax=Genypterus blacodes TaxID=154954 RepID=UPI003F770F17
MSSHASFLLVITLWASMQDGFGHPMLQREETETSDLVPTHKERNKRCACTNRLDSECHYFCHLDIIWVNTPSKTTVYGLGGALSRRRRATGRCTCANPGDNTCSSFCRQSLDIKSTKTVMRRLPLDLLSILRAAACSAKRALSVKSSGGEEEDAR